MFNQGFVFIWSMCDYNTVFVHNITRYYFVTFDQLYSGWVTVVIFFSAYKKIFLRQTWYQYGRTGIIQIRLKHQSWQTCHRMKEGAGSACLFNASTHRSEMWGWAYCPGSSELLFPSYFVSKGCCICAAVCDCSSVHLHKREVCSLAQEGTLLVRRKDGSTLKESLSKWVKHSARSPAKLSLTHCRLQC